MGTMYGYIRVSTKEQNHDRQLAALKKFGISEKFIFIDKQSGKDFNRPAYRRMMRKLHSEDVLVVKSIDRLGRNYTEILEQWRIITKKKRAAIVILDMPILDTRKKNGSDLIGTVVSDIVLQLLSYVAETERSFIHQRQAEGISIALSKGVKFGRKEMARPVAFTFIRNQWENNTVSARTAAKLLGITHKTFLSWVRDSRKEE